MAKKTGILKVLGRPVVRVYTKAFFSANASYRENLIIRDFTR